MFLQYYIQWYKWLKILQEEKGALGQQSTSALNLLCVYSQILPRLDLKI